MNREKEICPGSNRSTHHRVAVNLRSKKWLGECSVCLATGLEVNQRTGQVAEHTRFVPLAKAEQPSAKQTNQDIWGD